MAGISRNFVASNVLRVAGPRTRLDASGQTRLRPPWLVLTRPFYSRSFPRKWESIPFPWIPASGLVENPQMGGMLSPIGNKHETIRSTNMLICSATEHATQEESF